MALGKRWGGIKKTLANCIWQPSFGTTLTQLLLVEKLSDDKGKG